MEKYARKVTRKIQMKLRYTNKSKEDLEIAIAWYEKQRRGLGFEFLDCIEVAIKSIVERPELY